MISEGFRHTERASPSTQPKGFRRRTVEVAAATSSPEASRQERAPSDAIYNHAATHSHVKVGLRQHQSVTGAASARRAVLNAQRVLMALRTSTTLNLGDQSVRDGPKNRVADCSAPGNVPEQNLTFNSVPRHGKSL